VGRCERCSSEASLLKIKASSARLNNRVIGKHQIASHCRESHSLANLNGANRSATMEITSHLTSSQQSETQRTRQDRTVQDRKRQDGTRQDRIGQDRISSTAPHRHQQEAVLSGGLPVGSGQSFRAPSGPTLGGECAFK
jgi:hypothetical protein